MENEKARNPEVNLLKRRVLAFTDGSSAERDDDIVIESPLEIRVNGKPSYYCMRMPGMDVELAAGLCFSDGRLLNASDLRGASQPDENTVDLIMNESEISGSAEMKIILSSSGVIRKGQDLLQPLNPIDGHDGCTFAQSMLFAAQRNFFSRQKVFELTGAVHAAALYGSAGNHLVFAEDVGRHNALDKCVGSLILSGRIDDAFLCLLSSRLSYEMVIKGCRAGVKIIAGVSAPTSLAIDLAAQKGITLIGFLRNTRFNVYTARHRIEIE